MYKTMKKIIAATIVAVMSISYLQILGICVNEVYATNSKLEEQGVSTNNNNVEFDAYFNVEGKEVHTTTKTIGESNAIYAKIKVKDAGYLKEAQIEMKGASNKSANFDVLGIENEAYQSTEGNKIKLNKIESGKDIIIEIPISFVQKEIIDASSFSNENEIKLSGIYVDSNGDSKNVEKTIKLELNWKAEAEAQISQEITRYIPYTIGKEKGIILQTAVRSGIIENKLPIKQTKIEIQAPSINGKNPTEIKVTANALATNGTQKTLSEEEYKYNKETGKIEVMAENSIKEDGTITWKKQVQDEYIITYIYSQEALEAITEEGIKIEIEAKAQIEVYGNEQKVLEVSVPREEKTLKEKINDIVTAQTQTTQSISKGFLYSNRKSAEGEKQETQYTQKSLINISYAEIIDKLTLTVDSDNFIYNNEAQESANGKTYIKDLYIKRENYIDLLGEEGTITILSKEGATLATITKETKADEQGNIVINIKEMNVSSIVIEISKPQKEGTLEISVNKAIKENANLVNMQNYKALRTNTKLEAIKEGVSITAQTQSIDILLTEPYSKIDVQMNKTNLSTIVENKNVEIKAILDTSNSNYALYKNPVIELVLPEHVEKVSINSVKTYFNEELKIAKYEVVSQRIIRVELTGEQTKYDIGLVARGLNIIIDANISTKKLTPTIASEIKMYVQHENSNLYEKTEGSKGVVTLPIQFVAPVGIVTANSISNYNSRNEEMVLISGEGQTASLDVLSTAKLATVENIIINNSTAPINNVRILGRTISKGNKNIQTGEDLGTTFDSIMKTGLEIQGIDLSKVTIYYSENASATKDLTNSANGWVTQVQDLSKVKSYLVVLNDYQMEIGTIISIKYNTEIPAELSRNQYGYTTYAVYYNNAYLRTASEENLVAPLAEVTTGEGPEIKVEISSNVENGAEVQEGQIIKYKAKLTNTGKNAVEGVIVGAEVPEGTTYVEYVAGIDSKQDSYNEIETKKRVTKSYKTLQPGESGEVEFEVRVNELQESDDEHDEDGKPIVKEVTIKAKAFGTVLNLDAVANSDEITNKVVEGYLVATMTTNPGIATVLKGDSTLTYVVEIKNINNNAMKNLVIKDKLPEGLKFVEAYYSKDMTKNNAKYDEKTGEITYNIGELAGGKSLELYLVGTVDREKYNMTEIRNSMQVTFTTPKNETKTFITNEVINSTKIEKADLTATLTSDIPEGTIQEGETINYIFELTNTGTKTLQDIRIMCIYPSILEYAGSKYEIDGIESEIEGSSGEEVQLVASLQAGKKLKYILMLKVKEMAENEEKVEIENYFNIYHSEIGAFATNTLKHTAIKSSGNPSNPNDPSNPDNPTGTSRRIQGQVWLDENEDGKKDENETKIRDVEVMLFNYETGKVVTNAEGKPIVIKTDENGRYEFTNLPMGQYAVIFLYDTANYKSTLYRQEGVDPIQNSDAIDSKITLDGTERIAALTEKIDLASSNIYNIDLGLVKDKKFDLKLEKTVASITVQNQTGTAKYEYNNQLAKRDLTGRYLEDTTIVVEYKIAITNEGAIEGYAKKVVDYIPSNFKFNAELNRAWYQLEDGSVCSSSLANTKIQPGETKEITLLLTKSVKESDLTIISNTAEILEAYNDLGVSDVDSTPGNKQSNEDDISTADILLTVRTGAQTIMFISLTLGIIAIIGIGAYFINKKVIRRIK